MTFEERAMLRSLIDLKRRERLVASGARRDTTGDPHKRRDYWREFKQRARRKELSAREQAAREG